MVVYDHFGSINGLCLHKCTRKKSERTDTKLTTFKDEEKK